MAPCLEGLRTDWAEDQLLLVLDSLAVEEERDSLRDCSTRAAGIRAAMGEQDSLWAEVHIRSVERRLDTELEVVGMEPQNQDSADMRPPVGNRRPELVREHILARLVDNLVEVRRFQVEPVRRLPVVIARSLAANTQVERMLVAVDVLLVLFLAVAAFARSQ